MPTTADQALYTVLAAHQGLRDLGLGEGDTFRCYPVEAPPEGAVPLLFYQAITTSPNPSHGAGEQRKDEHYYQVTALAATALAAAAMLHQVRLAIEGSEALRADLIDERALPRAEEANVHGRSADFHFWNDPDAA